MKKLTMSPDIAKHFALFEIEEYNFGELIFSKSKVPIMIAYHELLGKARFYFSLFLMEKYNDLYLSCSVLAFCHLFQRGFT